jgi:hypothetical protein
MASFGRLLPTIPLYLTKPSEQFKFGSFTVTIVKPVEQETNEHCASELANGILEPRQFLLCGVQKTHWFGQEATLKASRYLFLCSGHEDGVHCMGLPLPWLPGRLPTYLVGRPVAHAYCGLNCCWRRVSICG